MSSAEPVIFGTVAEGARKAFAPLLTAPLLKEMSAVGFDLVNTQAAYALAPFVAAPRLLCEAACPGLPPAEQHRQPGRHFMQGYQHTTLGGAVLMLAKVVGLERTLLRIGRNLRTAGNYVEAEAVDLGPQSIRVKTRVLPELRERITPEQLRVTNAYRVGVFEGIADAFGRPREVTMEGAPETPELSFLVTWR